MAEKITKKDREKKMKVLTGLAVMPFYVIYVDNSIRGAYLAIFGPVPQAGIIPSQAVSKLLGVSLFLAVGVMALMSYLWARPAMLYTKDPRASYREKMRARVGSIYPDMAKMFAAALLVRLAFLFFGGEVPRSLILSQALPAMLVSTLVQACIMLIYVDSQFAKNQAFMELLFSKEELYLPRKGFYLPLYLKVSALLVACALVPFAFIYAALYRELPCAAYMAPMNGVLLLSSFTLVVGLGFIFNGIQTPLDGLIDKMRRVSEGDYEVKTRVYFSDEVARLKAGFNEMVDGLKERAELQDTFGKYMSIEIARELIKNKKVNLGGEDIEAAVMFCDIRNFTPLSESLSATAVVEFLNNYFRYITPPITSHNGVISKFMGDAVMAIYTPLLGSSDYAADALKSAAGMRAALAEFNASGKFPVPVNFGIGIHSGRLVAGNIGTFSRLEYTFIGDTVNIASRLQSKTKDFGTDIIVSEAALAKARGSLGGSMAFEPLGKAALKGKSEAVEIFKVL